MIYEIGLGVVFFTAMVLALVGLILLVRARVVATGNVQLIINDRRPVTAAVGTKLLDALTQAGIHLPSGCGGKGTCGQCRVLVSDGGGAVLPTELAQMTEREARDGTRLACQVSVKRNITVQVPDDMLDVEQWQCTVRSNDNVATMIKELVLGLPPGKDFKFRAGSYIQVFAPPYELSFKDFNVAPNYRDEWDRLDLWRYASMSRMQETRAYSMANYPGEDDGIKLDVRIAIPPPGADPIVPPGVVSSYIFSLKPGDTVTVSGPFGHFYAPDTENEMVFIGGGAGMAPMRSHIMDQLRQRRSNRKISFWYGARSRRELFYVNDFDKLQAEHANFEWHVAFSDPKPNDGSSGRTGFIHEVLRENYLDAHPAPEDCEYYVCGPPMMLRAVLAMLDDLGVDPENIFHDDFGG